MIFELVQDLHEAIAAMPKEHPKHCTISLLGEAIRRDIHFIVRHPTTLFQCMWNSCWWYDCPEADKHYVQIVPKQEYYDVVEDSSFQFMLPWNRPGTKLSGFIENWHQRRSSRRVATPWLRSMRPPQFPIGGPQVSVFRGHTASVEDVAFSPDGKLIGSASLDGKVALWDPSSGRQLASFSGHSTYVSCLAFLSQERVVSGDHNSTLRIWDARSGKELQCLQGHTEGVSSVAVSPTGDQIVSGSHDSTLCVWSAQIGELLRCIRGHKSGVYSVAFSADGYRIASSSQDKTVRIWDGRTGRQLLCLQGHRGPVYSVAFSPDGSRLVSGSWDKTVRIWDAVNGELLSEILAHDSDVTNVSYSADGRRIVSTSLDGTVRLWNSDDDQLMTCFFGHEDQTYAAVFSSDDKWLVSGSFDGTLRLWDSHWSGSQLRAADNWEKLLGLQYPSRIRHTAWRQLAGKEVEGLPLPWSSASPRELRIMDKGGGIISLPLIPTMRSFRALSSALETVVEDVSTAAQVASYPVPLEDIITHPSGNVWAGALNHHMVIFLLEELGMNNAPDGIESSKAYVDLAKDLQTRGEIEGAKRAFESAIRAAEPLLNERQRDTELTHAVQWLYETVGAILWEQGKESEALQYFEKALALADSMVDESQPTAEMKWNLARVLYIVGTLRSEVMGIAAAQSALIRCHQTLLIMRAMDVPLPTEAEELLKSMGALADRLRASGMSVEVYGQ